jgi:subtilisin family serine protease
VVEAAERHSILYSPYKAIETLSPIGKDEPMRSRATLVGVVALLLVALLALGDQLLEHRRSTSGSAKFRRVARPIPNSYIVALQGEAAADPSATANRLVARVGGQVTGVYRRTLHGFSAAMTEEAARSVSRDPLVAWVEQDAVATKTERQLANGLWSLDRIDQRDLPLDKEYHFVAKGRGVHVYVIDGGVNTAHTDFGGRASTGIDLTGGACGYGTDCDSHGSGVAGVIGGRTYGVAKSVTLVSVKVNCGGAGSATRLVDGVEWVTAHHAKPAVANMSVTVVGGSTAVDAAVLSSIRTGITYVAGAGNDNVDTSTYSPARVEDVITVGAMQQDGSRAPYSNFGPRVDLFAPTDAPSVSNADANSHSVISGTSGAAPHVTGVIARYLQSNPDAAPATVARILLTHATPGQIKDPGQGTSNRLLYSPWGELRPAADYDGDGRSDVTAWRPSTGLWQTIVSSAQQVRNQNWGANEDMPLAADFDDDGKTDHVIFRPPNGTWYIRRSKDGSPAVKEWGVALDIGVPGDYDGDGSTDYAVWRRVIGRWFILKSASLEEWKPSWGVDGDLPVPGDYDADGVTDPTVWRPSNGTWYVFSSRAGKPDVNVINQWGREGDIPIPGDYFGDGQTDQAVWRPSNATWYILSPLPFLYVKIKQFGQSGDVPVPGDYDGDGTTDLAVWRPTLVDGDPMKHGIWHILNSSTGQVTTVDLGVANDLPVPSCRPTRSC